jgi:hypothetical protein
MKKWIAVAIVGALTLVALPAFAQDEPAPPAGGGGEGGAGTTTYDFEDDLVSGDLVRPDGELLNVRRRGSRSSLIRIREHFIPEMLKSVENL